MGNSVAAGYVVEKTGLASTVGFHQTLAEAMYFDGIESWDPKTLLQSSLEKQSTLCKTSPLRFVQVGDGLRFYGSQVGFFHRLTREKFVQMSLELFRQKGLHLPADEATVFYDVFDAIDLYKNATLSLGELAGGLSSFLGGTIDQKTDAVFDLLAAGRGSVPKSALHEFLKPYVWCMVPRNASALRPVLLPHVTDDIFADISISGVDQISKQELTRWLQKGQLLQGQTSPHQQMLSITVAERVAMSITMALKVACEKYELKHKLRAYGQQTWEENRGRSQYITDVGAYRYAQQHAPRAMSKAYTAASSSASVPATAFFSSLAQSSSQFFETVQEWMTEEDSEELPPARPRGVTATSKSAGHTMPPATDSQMPTLLGRR